MTQRRITRRVLVHGLIYFGPIFARFMDGDGWEFRYYPDKGVRNLAAMLGEMTRSDVLYQLGGRVTEGKFLKVAHALSKNKIVMHWLGSDTLDEQIQVSQQKSDAWVLGKLHHWAESQWMVDEVEALGVPCQLVPFPSALVPDGPSALREQFRVLVYVPSIKRGELYGLDRILSVARDCPDVSFDLVGLIDGPIPEVPANLHVYGRLANLSEFYERCSVVWRPVRHDGVSWMVLEALGHGRHVLWTHPFPGCIQVGDEFDAREQITRLHESHRRGLLQLNHEGLRFTRYCYHPATLRKNIHLKLRSILDS